MQLKFHYEIVDIMTTLEKIGHLSCIIVVPPPHAFTLELEFPTFSISCTYYISWITQKNVFMQFTFTIRDLLILFSVSQSGFLEHCLVGTG